MLNLQTNWINARLDDNPRQPECKVRVSNGIIQSIQPGSQIDSNWRLTPGLIDLHTHGIESFCYEIPDQLIEGARVLPKYGVTTFLPTIVPKPDRSDFLDRLSSLAAAVEKIDTVNVPGFHLEGPFVGLGGAACPTLPGDLGLLRELVSACREKVTVMSIAPEVDNILPVIEWLREHRIVPFITHTKANVEQTLKAISAGARHATHFYDVFYAPDPPDGGVRPVGCVEAMLADPRCTVDFICDGVHVHPVAIKAVLAAKGPDNVMLITDSNIGAGLPAGVYESPWGYKVKVDPDNGARIEDPGHPKHGSLAGSALTMDAGINRLFEWLDMPAARIWSMATANQARILNLPDKGTLTQGADADLVLWEQNNNRYKVVCTWVGGRCVYVDEEADLRNVRG